MCSNIVVVPYLYIKDVQDKSWTPNRYDAKL